MQPGQSSAAPCSTRPIAAGCRSSGRRASTWLSLLPPYWQIKDYGSPGQIGYGQSLHEYLRDLDRVWDESFTACCGTAAAYA